MIVRTLEKQLGNDLRHKSVLVLGPRQVGKSTLLNSLMPDLAINLTDESQFRDHLKDPGLIRRQVESLTKPSITRKQNPVILVDEIQRIPSMLNTIQALIDENKSRRFLLTGSSARKLKKGKSNLLPGRLFSRRLYPLSWWELGSNFQLEKALRLGTLPEIYLEAYGEELLKNYIDTYLREEIMSEALVRGVDQFARFLDLAAEASGQELNYSQLASDSEIPKETLRRFYELLEDTLLITTLKGFSDIKTQRKAVQRDKKIFFDMGVKNAILKRQRNTFSDTELGMLFEQWFINQLIIYANDHALNWDFYYYRDDLKREVDLIVDTGKKIMALEIKYSTKTKNEYFDKLSFFKELCKKPCESIIIFRGKIKEHRNGVTAIPYDLFLSELE